MVGAARLDIDTYEEVEADTTATGQAAVVVALAGIALAIGAARAGLIATVAILAWQLIGWSIWAGITYLIGSTLFRGTATWGELLRTLGFAQAPSILAVFAIIPGIRFILLPVLGIWTLVAGIIAIRQALDFSTGKAIITALIGWLVLMIPRMLLGGLSIF
jgi:hypothetical protein